MSFLLHESVYFSIFGLKIYMYGVMITLGILAGVALAFWTFKKRNLNTDHIVNIGLIAIPCAILGARIYYCLFYDKSYDFLSFFDITSGGLAVYGAIIGGAIAVLVYCLIRKINFFQMADAIVPCLAIGQCLGRIGCYFGGCCYGEETTLQMFPFSVEIDGVWHLATFFYESFATLIICIVLLVLLRYVRLNGFVFCAYFLLYGIARFFIEGVRGDSLYFLGMRVSQLLSAILIVCAIGLAIFFVFYYKKKGCLQDIWVVGGKSALVNAELQDNSQNNVEINKIEVKEVSEDKEIDVENGLDKKSETINEDVITQEDSDEHKKDGEKNKKKSVKKSNATLNKKGENVDIE